MKLAGFNPYRAGWRINNGHSRSASFSSDDKKTPAETDVVVIGGGIAGLLTAIYLRERGLRTVICEKGEIAAEQTSRALGWASSLGDAPGRSDLSIPSKKLWADLVARSDSGLTYNPNGLLLACHSESEVSDFEFWIAANKERADARILSRAEAEAHLGTGSLGNARAAVFQPSDATVEPTLVGKQLAEMAAHAGATIVQHCAVRGVETSAGALSGVVTEHGTIKTTLVVVAAGTWTRLFCGNLGIDVPILNAASTLARTSPIAGGPGVSGSLGGVGWRADLDGGYTIGRNSAVASIVPDTFRLMRRFLPALREIGSSVSIDLNREFFEALFEPRHWNLDQATPFEKARILDGKPDLKQSKAALAIFKKKFPAAASATITECWGGIVDTTPDRLPILSAVDRLPGLYLCSGFSAHGLAMAPAAAQLVADLIDRRTPDIPPSPYRLERFSA